MAVTNPGQGQNVCLTFLWAGVRSWCCEWYNGSYGSCAWNGFWWHSMYDICCRNFEFNISLARSLFLFVVSFHVCTSGWLSLPSAIRTRHWCSDGVGGFAILAHTHTHTQAPEHLSALLYLLPAPSTLWSSQFGRFALAPSLKANSIHLRAFIATFATI